jgi:hypothetical protein
MKLATAAALALALTFAAASSFAADPPAKTLTAQQQRMKDCNGQAKGKKGEERRAFMSTCLKGGTATASTGKAAAPAKSKVKAANAGAH